MSSVTTLAQESQITLDTLQVEGEKLSRTAADVTPNIAIIPYEKVEAPANRTIFSSLRGISNIIADEDGDIPTVRGISSAINNNQLFGSGISPRVPVLVDNVAQPVNVSTGLMTSSSWDVGMVEVAKGPQPTSTGRNAFSGAIRVYTNDPVFDREYALRLGGQNFRQNHNIAFVANEQLIEDQLAVRFSGILNRGDTVVNIKDPKVTRFNLNERRLDEIRGKIRAKPKAFDGLDMQFTFKQIKTRDHYAPVIEPNSTEITPNLSDYGTNTARDNTTKKSYIAEASYEISDHYKWFARFSKTDNESTQPFSGTPYVGFRNLGSLQFKNRETEFETYMQLSDLGIISKGVVGIIHNRQHEDAANDVSEVKNLNPFRFVVDGAARNSGIYGELEIDLETLSGALKGLALIAGGRYERDKRKRQLSADGVRQTEGNFKENIFLPKLGIRYNYTDDWEAGYTYSESYRPAGIEIDLVSGFLFPVTNKLAVAEFAKETIKNHEVYLKSSMLDDRLSLGATFFYYKYNGAQVPGASPTDSAYAGFGLTGNIPKATGKGLELNANFTHDSGLKLYTDIGYLRAKVTNAGKIATAFQGATLPNAPKFSGSLGIGYEHGSGLDVNLRYRYVGSMRNELGGATVSSYSVADLAAGYSFKETGSSALDQIRVDFFVNNLFDKRYLLSNSYLRRIIGTPRTVGLALTIRL